MTESQPTLWLIAGPNGVGKTTYAFRHVQRISGSIHFVNLDEIARGLSPLRPDAARLRAARVALSMQNDFLARRESFSLETTLFGMTYLGLVRRAEISDFESIFSFSLSSRSRHALHGSQNVYPAAGMMCLKQIFGGVISEPIKTSFFTQTKLMTGSFGKMAARAQSA
jgi:hypothetical protein